MPPETQALAPGARVEIRDEEWIIRSVKPTSESGQAVHVVGVSELVAGKEWIFLTALDDVRELKPEDTELVHDDSPYYRHSRLYLEALLRRSPATDDALHIGHRGAIHRTDYQMQPAAKALAQLRPRILMADAVGLGKTIEAGILLSELIQRGQANRILVVALKSILAQFQKELWARFTIPLVRLDSVGIQRVQSRIPSNMNPFYFYDRVIISIDTLKRDAKYRRYLENCRWDVVVVDECQHVAERSTGMGRSQRARLAQLLARTCDSLILTSATPHDGQPKSFASLIKLLEPSAIANDEDYTSDEVSDFFIRRFKKDIAHEAPGAFMDRDPQLEKRRASPEEDAVFEALNKAAFRTVQRVKHGKGKGILFRTHLLKSFLSSPAALIETMDNRLGKKALEDETDSAVAHDRKALGQLRELAERVKPNRFTKYGVLLEQLRSLGFGEDGATDRVVIFSERIATLRFLEEALKKDLGLKKDAIAVFHGQLRDIDQTVLVESFGTEKSPIRILLASDAASEGLNLHYYCHRLFHFDLPWSLITLEQRNGRIDRYGQTRTPHLTYLLTVPNDPGLQGDLRVLDRLVEKEEYAHKNLGDVAWLMNLHDAEREEERIALGIEQGESAEEIIPSEAEHNDFFELLIGEEETPPIVKDPLRLFSDDLEYAKHAFEEVLGGYAESVEWHDHLDGFTLHPPDDLALRLEYLPPELGRNGKALKLTADRQLVMNALDEARQEESKWPEWQLLWEQHPVAEWLDDRVLGKLARHQAPVLSVKYGLAPTERLLVFQGMVSNERSQPRLVEWFGVRFDAGGDPDIVPFDQLVSSTQLAEHMANPGGDLPASLIRDLHALRKPAAEAAREHVLGERRKRAVELAGVLRESMDKLKAWRDRAQEQLDLWRDERAREGGRLSATDERRCGARQSEADKIYAARKRWVQESLRTVTTPYLRLVAAIVPQEIC